jgi:putative membrane protein
MHHTSILVPVVHLLLTAVSVVIVAHVLPGIYVRSYFSAVKFAIVVAILNAILWGPLAHAFTWLTLGIGGLILNGVIFLIAGSLVGGVRISGCLTGALAAGGVWLVNQAMHIFLGLGRWAP